MPVGGSVQTNVQQRRQSRFQGNRHHWHTNHQRTHARSRTRSGHGRGASPCMTWCQMRWLDPSSQDCKHSRRPRRGCQWKWRKSHKSGLACVYRGVRAQQQDKGNKYHWHNTGYRHHWRTISKQAARRVAGRGVADLRSKSLRAQQQVSRQQAPLTHHQRTHARSKTRSGQGRGASPGKCLLQCSRYPSRCRSSQLGTCSR